MSVGGAKNFSTLDGYGTVEEYALRSVANNQNFLTVTDHGMMGVIPRQIRACDKICDKHGKDKLSPIFGCELYVNRLQPATECLEDMRKFTADLNEEEAFELKASPHLLAIAYNETGYKNLVRLSSWGWTKGFYRRPRVNYEQLQKHKEGLIFTSCCYNSEIGRAYEAGGEEAACAMIERYVGMFGKEDFYLEIMLLDFKKQKPYDAFIVKAKEKYGLKLIITNDVHYCNKQDSHFQRLMLMVQTNRSIKDIQRALAEDNMRDFFELQDANLWFKSEEELNEKWIAEYSDVIPYELFCEAKRTTVEVCRKAKGVKLDRSLKLPQIPNADDILKDEVLRGAKFRGIPQTREYLNRIKEEYSLIVRKGFASYFLIQKMMTDEARRVCVELLGWGDGSQALGPGRGSAVGALTCYCLGITNVDPVREGLLFSRFLSEARGGRSLVLEFKNIDPLPPHEAFKD
jgi:DNA polymerase-3 subunit alpha